MNVLDYPAITIPVTSVDQEIDKVGQDFSPLTELDKKNMDGYDPEVYHGAPAGIQIIGMRYSEEHLLRMAQIVRDALVDYDKMGGS
ncbi:Acetamidase [Apiospora marii]|uniref:Acetamidase n=1 Tax=Apiospora marii TaxID=335849 RepID=UPI003131A97C